MYDHPTGPIIPASCSKVRIVALAALQNSCTPFVVLIKNLCFDTILPLNWQQFQFLLLFLTVVTKTVVRLTLTSIIASFDQDQLHFGNYHSFIHQTSAGILIKMFICVQLQKQLFCLTKSDWGTNRLSTTLISYFQGGGFGLLPDSWATCFVKILGNSM